MDIRNIETKELLYMDYRFNHCDGDCESCPCKTEGYRCSYIHDEVRKELNNRD